MKTSLAILLGIYSFLAILGLLQRKPRAIKLGNIIPMRNAPEGMLFL